MNLVSCCVHDSICLGHVRPLAAQPYWQLLNSWFVRGLPGKHVKRSPAYPSNVPWIPSRAALNPANHRKNDDIKERRLSALQSNCHLISSSAVFWFFFYIFYGWGFLSGSHLQAPFWVLFTVQNFKGELILKEAVLDSNWEIMESNQCYPVKNSWDE